MNIVQQQDIEAFVRSFELKDELRTGISISLRLSGIRTRQNSCSRTI